MTNISSNQEELSGSSELVSVVSVSELVLDSEVELLEVVVVVVVEGGSVDVDDEVTGGSIIITNTESDADLPAEL